MTSGALQILIANDVPGQGPSSETITLGQVTLSGLSADGGPDLAVAPDQSRGAGAGTVTAGTGSTLRASSNCRRHRTAPLDHPPNQSVALVPQVATGGGADGARLSAMEFSVEGTYPLLVTVGLPALAESLLTRLLAVRLWR